MRLTRERAINAPGPVVLLILVLLGGFAVQQGFGVDAVASVWGFAPRDLAAGRYATLITAVFLHGSWPHVLANTTFALAFATPVSRRLGGDALGVAAFFLFYLVCGVLGNLGYAALDPGGRAPVVGASGAVAGMMGAASRLIGGRGAPLGEGGLAPLTSRTVVTMAASWIVINLIFGLVLPGWAPGTGGAPIAWQVHLAGYAAGLLLLGPLLFLLGRGQVDHGLES